jgi:hypothetical protein
VSETVSRPPSTPLVRVTNVKKNPSNGSPPDDGFSEFWSAYPRHEDKKRAAAKWASLKPDEAMRGKIMAALDRQRRSPQWTRDGGKFIPHPTTWLNGERWEDEQLTVMNGKMNGKANGAAVDETTWKQRYRDRYRDQGVEVDDAALEYSWNTYASGRYRQ